MNTPLHFKSPMTPFDGGRGDYVWEFIRDWNIMKLEDYTRTEWTMAYCIHCVWEFIKEGMKGKVILYHLLIKKMKVILYHLPFICLFSG